MVSFESLCVYWKWPRFIQRYQVLTVLFGAFLVHLSLGSFYTLGNMIPYIVSYIRNQSQPDWIRTSEAPVVTAMFSVGHGGMMVIGGLLEKRIGPRLATLLGCTIMTAGVLLTFFTIRVSFWLVLVTYGFMCGAGTGIAYIGPVTCAMKWLPKWKALAVGIVVSGFGLSATIFNAVQTAYINPANLFPDVDPYPDKPKEKYFTQQGLLERVDYCFLILGGAYAVLQLIGCVFLVNPLPPDNGYDSIQNVAGKGAEDEKQEPVKTSLSDLGPRKMLLNIKFYFLWSMFFLAGVSITFLTSLYKQFGLEERIDDHFLTTVGSISAVFNLLGRIFWGIVADVTSYKFALVCVFGMMTCLLLTLDLVTIAGQWMYLVWVCALFFCVGGVFSLFPAGVSSCFGQKYLGINYGILFSSQVAGSIIAAFLVSQLVIVIGWWGVFFLLAGLSGMGMLLGIIHSCTA